MKGHINVEEVKAKIARFKQENEALEKAILDRQTLIQNQKKEKEIQKMNSDSYFSEYERGNKQKDKAEHKQQREQRRVTIGECQALNNTKSNRSFKTYENPIYVTKINVIGSQKDKPAITQLKTLRQQRELKSSKSQKRLQTQSVAQGQIRQRKISYFDKLKASKQ